MRTAFGCLIWGLWVQVLGSGMVSIAVLSTNGLLGTGWIAATLAGIDHDPLPAATGGWERVWMMFCTGLVTVALICIFTGIMWLYGRAVPRLAGHLKAAGL